MDWLGSTKKIVYILSTGTGELIDVGAKSIFGERISASFSQSKSFQLTLQNLSYKDVGTFELQVTVKRGNAIYLKSGEKKLSVLGMLFII